METTAVPRNAHLAAKLVSLEPDLRRFLSRRRALRADDKDNLDDQVQTVMTEALASLPRYREEGGSLRAWLLGIAINIARQDERGRVRRAWVLGMEEEALGVTTSPERAVRMRELRAKVGAALHTMPEGLFSVLCHVGIEGKSHKEAASLLGITEGASRKRLQEARAYLEKETGITREELVAVFPLAFFFSDERRSTLRDAFPWLFPTGHTIAAILASILALPLASASLERPSASPRGVAISRVEKPVMDVESAPAPMSGDDAHSPPAAKVVAQPRAAPPAPPPTTTVQPGRIVLRWRRSR